MGTFAAENQDVSLFLGEDLIVYLVLAFGAALVAGNLAAIFRPPPEGGARRGGRGRGGDAGSDAERLERAPMGRSLVMAGIGLVAALWALLSLLNG